MKHHFFTGRILTAIVVLLFAAESFSQTSEEMRQWEYAGRLKKDQLYDMAAMQYDRFTEQFPFSANIEAAYFRKAESLYSAGRKDSAKQAFFECMYRFPGSFSADSSSFRLAELFENDGNYTEAIASYERIASKIDKTPLSYEASIRMIRLYMKMENYSIALQYANKLNEASVPAAYKSKGLFFIASIHRFKNEMQEAVDIYKRLISRPVLSDDAIAAKMELGKVYMALQDWSRALEQFSDLANSGRNDREISAAWYFSGQVHQFRADYEEALNSFDKAAGLTDSDTLRSKALLRTAHILYSLSNPQGSLEAMQKINLRMMNPDELHEKSMLGARAFLAAGDTIRAIRELSTFLENKKFEFSADAALKLASLYRKQGFTQNALDVYQMLYQTQDDQWLKPWILFARAKIFIEDLNLYEEGFAELRNIWNEYPGNPVVQKARFLYAEGLLSARRINQAESYYENIIKTEPWSIYAEKAEESLRELFWYEPDSGPDLYVRMTGLMHNIVTGDNASSHSLEMASFAFEKLKQYDTAIKFYEKYLSDNPEEADHILNLLVHSGYRQYCKNQNTVYREKIFHYADQLAESYPESVYTAEAQWLAALTRLEKGVNDSIIGFVIEKYPQIIANPAIALEAAGFYRDSHKYENALKLYINAANENNNTKYAEEALFYTGWIYSRTGQVAAADSVWSVYHSNFSNQKHSPRALFLHGKFLSEQNPARAFDLFDLLKTQYPRSQWADSASQYLAGLYAKMDKYEEASRLYEEAVQKAEQYSLLVTAGLIDPAEFNLSAILKELASVYARQKNFLKAEKTWSRYIQISDGSDQAEVWKKMAELADLREKPDETTYYLERIHSLSPTFEHAMMLGSHFFNAEQYARALKAYETALSLAEADSNKLKADHYAVLSQLRTDQISGADARINRFRSEYRETRETRDYFTQFDLEKAKAYIRMKNFEPAETLLRQTRRSRNNDLAAESLFELGRLYIILNKVDDALKILTEMPNNYPGHPILSKVYYFLGMHYFNSGQLNNAVYAFRQAINADQPDPAILPAAYSQLMSTYERLGMFDAALLTARQFTDLFNNHEAAFSTRIKIGSYYMKIAEFDRAIEYFQSIKPMASPEDEAEIQLNIGLSYQSMGRHKEAVFEFLKVNYLSADTRWPWKTTALFEAAKSYVKMDARTQALNLYNKIIQKEGAASHWGRYAREQIDQFNLTEHIKDG